MNLYCANVHCLYWEEGCCCLDEVYLNVQGVCADCKVMPLEDGMEEKRMALRDKSELVDQHQTIKQMLNGLNDKNRNRRE